MINKEVKKQSDDKEDKKKKSPVDDALGTAMDRVVIRDKDTGAELLNRRG